MFERFKREAREVVKAAQQEARAGGASHVRPEHVLVALADVRRAVESAFGPDAWAPTCEGRLPFAPKTKRALEHALREAVELRTRRIGSRELLLGLLRTSDEARALVARCGVDPRALYERHRDSIESLARFAAR